MIVPVDYGSAVFRPNGLYNFIWNGERMDLGASEGAGFFESLR